MLLVVMSAPVDHQLLASGMKFSLTGLTAAALLAPKWQLVLLLLLVVLPEQRGFYGNPANYLIAEYGSLSEQQRNVSYVKKAAQAFVRSLAAYPANKNGVADRNAFTFGHDAQLNFNTSFTGKDLLNFRLRSNTIYSFAKRVGAPFADLAVDGSLPEELDR